MPQAPLPPSYMPLQLTSIPMEIISPKHMQTGPACGSVWTTAE